MQRPPRADGEAARARGDRGGEDQEQGARVGGGAGGARAWTGGRGRLSGAVTGCVGVCLFSMVWLIFWVSTLQDGNSMAMGVLVLLFSFYI